MTETLKRVLRFRDVFFIVLGTIIGSGIFLVPGSVLRQSGGYYGVALVVWLAGGLLSLLGALAYGELGAMRPRAGGLYVYLRDAFGPLTAFLYGWTFFLVIGGGTAAALAVAFTSYLEQFLPLGPMGRRVAAVAMLAVIAMVNIRGTRHGATVQNWSTAIKATALVALALLLVIAGSPAAGTPPPAWPERFDLSVLSGAGLAMLGVLWAYEGWQYATYSAGEVLEPQRTFPRAMMLGSGAIIVIYLLANIGYLAALGPAGVEASERVAADATAGILGAPGARAIAFVILISIFGAANGITLTAPRIYYAMARDGLFFDRLAAVHPRYGTPAVAIAAGTLWSMMLAVTGTFDQLLTYVVFVGWIFYGLGAACVLVLRRREPAIPRPFRTPGYPVTPLLFVLGALALVLNTVISQPVRGVVGLGAVLLGVPAFYFWNRRAVRREPGSVGAA